MNFENNNSFFNSGSTSFHRQQYFPAPPAPSYSSKDGPKSKAYINAMRSLQEKVKELEKEKSAWLIEKQEIINTVESEYQEIMRQYKKEIDDYLTKEFDYKERIRFLEEKIKENEIRLEENDEKNMQILSDQDKKMQSLNREIIDYKTRLQEEISINDDLKAEIRALKEKNIHLNDENKRNLEEMNEEKEILQEKLKEFEEKNKAISSELQELKTQYSYEINDYQEELLRIQAKFQAETDVLLQEKEQILLENRRLFNENSLKEEDLLHLNKKLENLQFERKKDDMYKQIMNEFQPPGSNSLLNRPNNNPFFNPAHNSSNSNLSFPVNHSSVDLLKHTKITEQSSSANSEDSSSNEDSEKEHKKKKKSTKDKKQVKRQKKKKEVNIMSESSDNDDLNFFKQKTLNQMSDFQKNFKEIVALENEIRQTNEKYQNLVLESQVIFP